MIWVALLGALAICIRTMEQPAPFIWIGLDGKGTIVWTLDHVQLGSVEARPIPYLALGFPIPLNTVDAITLASVVGFGPVKSHAILSYRMTHGCFERLSDLQRVHGIGPKTVQKVAPYLRIDGFDGGACASHLDG